MAEKEKKDANNEEELSPYDRLTSTQNAILMMLLEKKRHLKYLKTWVQKKYNN